MRVCVVVPMYNEQAIVRTSVETILSYTKKLPPVVNLLIVNDGSQDSTGLILEDLLREHQNDGLKVVCHSRNKGYGAAIKTGIKFAIENNYDYALFMDSDLTNHPRYLNGFYEKMNNGWDYIKATRYSKGGGTQGVPWKRRVISQCGNLFARVITGLPLTDITNGFRAVKIDILRQLQLSENHFSIIIEELMKARKITNSFCEIPYILGIRSKQAPPTKFVYSPTTFWKYLKYLFI